MTVSEAFRRCRRAVADCPRGVCGTHSSSLISEVVDSLEKKVATAPAVSGASDTTDETYLLVRLLHESYTLEKSPLGEAIGELVEAVNADAVRRDGPPGGV